MEIFPELPRELWALAGVIVTAFLAWLREKLKAQASPYEAMAERLHRVEERAALVPGLQAKFGLLARWADEATEWMGRVYEAYKEDTGIRYFPPPPIPPPHWDRRNMNVGPPTDSKERRHP